MKRWAAAAAVLCAVLCLGPREALAKTRLYVLSIGNNAPPPDDDSGGERLPTLHYADDDAAAFFTFVRDASDDAVLLTVLDARSQQRFPELARVAREPSLVELRRTLGSFKERFEADRRAGDDPVLLFFFSGHGTRSGEHPASLVMTDGPLTQAVLYDEVLAALPARYVHLLVDACYAEAVVRPRGGQSESVALSATDLQRVADRAVLSRFPNVGAIVATSVAERAFEWDAIERGVFTHEVISGLRGGADVNGDGRVEYDELVAFLTSANRDVVDPRARLVVVSHPPPLDHHATLFDLSSLRGGATLTGAPAALGRVSVEDERGNRLLDVHAEPDFHVTLHLPEGRLYVETASGAAELDATAGKTFDLGSLHFGSVGQLTARGAVEGALARGLFAARFGPSYFSAFVDGRSEVDEDVAPRFGGEDGLSDARARARVRTAGWVTLGTSGALAVATGIFAGVALAARSEYDQTSLERESTSAKDRYGTFAPLSVAFGGATLVTAAVGTWLVLRHPRESSLAVSGPRLVGSARGVGIAW